MQTSIYKLTKLVLTQFQAEHVNTVNLAVRLVKDGHERLAGEAYQRLNAFLDDKMEELKEQQEVFANRSSSQIATLGEHQVAITTVVEKKIEVLTETLEAVTFSLGTVLARLKVLGDKIDNMSQRTANLHVMMPENVVDEE